MINFLNKQKPVKPYKIICVTGSSGKTTVTNLIYHILTANGIKASMLSSEGYRDTSDNKIRSLTSDKLKAQGLKTVIKKTIKNNSDILVIELPFSFLKKKVVDNLTYDIGIITNSYTMPKDFENEKHFEKFIKQFVNKINDQGFLISNAQDQSLIATLNSITEKIKNNIFCYIVNQNNLRQQSFGESGLSFNYYDQGIVSSELIGDFNFSNIYIATRACSHFLEINQITNAIASFTRLPGKLDLIKDAQFRIYIDSAETNESIQKTLMFLQKIRKPRTKIISVIGAKDNTNSSIGHVASQIANVVILAPNDPNNNNVFTLNTNIYNKAEKMGGKLIERFQSSEELALIEFTKLKQKMTQLMVTNAVPVIAFDANDYSGRLDAIRFAIQIADVDDIIYISGKGAERTIIFNNTEFEWSDYEAVKIGLDSINRLKF